MIKRILKELKQKVREETIDLGKEDYIILLREISAWAEEEANIAEYEPDADDYED